MKNKSKITTCLYIYGLFVVLILYVKFGLINSTNSVSSDYIYNSQYKQQEKMYNALKSKNEYIVFLGDSLTSRGN